ncbi:division/cell wall cluster transcriptional repressor MraZ [Mesoplasma lactucae]|uniref:Transcriptional regulator MraZ n=1 Tax=Mesoplasma lactucae ATCC 49193 TaxID=81460 RepID=A0A291IRW5_9MOLU|nr:division/cell wall cluster transcriptional repressor MraZ [Mesoplasma lactucae]ATG97488.1 cell division/cell wall cluster transcriptional repressor MraZ [Mesoplasma lactucae ATCC 49193]ATZ20057.1 cell division protein MraZ [Mesoplasma lactucae ATCC 49193]MCL8216805.1 Transcriptional regulator MraZ [Mesoplasma lactucae ATCC 49193]
MELLIGKYAHLIDDKSRLTIPSKIRNKLSNVVYVSKGFEGCLEVRTPEAFSAYTNQIQQFSQTNPGARMVTREIFANTEEVEIDNAGRIRLSAEQLKNAGISKEVYIIGVIDHLEIWDRDKFDNYEAENEPKFEEVASQLGGNK